MVEKVSFNDDDNSNIMIDGLNVSNWDSPAVYQSLAAGGVTATNATIATWENYRETLDHVQAWLQRFANCGETLMQIKTTEDILEAQKTSKVGVILGFQNATPIENDLGHLEIFYALGVRIIQLTFHERNLLGDGCWESANAGLSNFGRDAVREMNRLGILIDLSHVGERSTLETIDYSEKPVAVTHANCRVYYDNPRNKTDEAVKLLAARGGVVGATAIASFLRTQFESTLEDFVDAVVSSRPPAVSYDDGRAALALAEAADRSRRTGRSVRLAEIDHPSARELERRGEAWRWWW